MAKKASAKTGVIGLTKPIYAAIDVGSHNVRMDLYGLDETGCLKKIKVTEQTVFPCKLAEGMKGAHPRIKRSNLALAVKAVKAFDAILRIHQILPHNTCGILTAAFRAVEHTPQGQADILKIRQSFAGGHLAIVTGDEEAELVGLAVRLRCPQKWMHHKGQRQSLAFAAIGGGSIELGMINKAGVIEDALALPIGVHPLTAQSHNRIPQAGRIFETCLHNGYPRRHSKRLAVVGGNWRGLGEALCGHLPAALDGKKIRSTLISATHRSPSYYRAKGGRAAERAEFMPIAAAMLRRTVQHLGVRKLVFLDVTIRDAMAHELHAARTGGLTSPSPSLERLFGL